HDDRCQYHCSNLHRVNHVTPSFPKSPAEYDHAELICPAETRIAQLIEPRRDSIAPKPVRACRENSESQCPHPGWPCAGRPADEARGDCLIVFGESAGK